MQASFLALAGATGAVSRSPLHQRTEEMGIRFTCHACTKRLNVKAFLAGKRGICPHCGAKVEIPWESQAGRESTAMPVAAPRDTGAARHAGTNGSSAPLASALPMHGSPSGISGNGPAAPLAAQPAVPMAAPAVAAAASTASPMFSPSAAPAAPMTTSPSSPSGGRAADPINEAPHAVWYVRPPSGGQYGPASGEIMRKWLSEGRVSSDSLIWREGWADWKTAGSLFPELGGSPLGASAVTPPQPAAAGPAVAASSSPVRAYPRKSKNSSLALVLVVVLTLAAIGLLGILFAAVTALQ